MKKTLTTVFIVALGLVAGSVYALSVFDITYPIAELGGCADRLSCKAYCDNSANADACLAFAKEYGIETSVQTSGPGGGPSQSVKIPDVGPGGCKGINECKTYCSDPAHTDECVAFGKAHGLISSENEQSIRQMTKLQDVLKSGGGPGGCTSPDTCKTYCSDPAHLDECVAFGEKNGLLNADQVAQIKQKGFTAVVGGPQDKGFQGPGNCKSNNECKAYCADPANQKTCIDFAVAHGFMSKEEADQAIKIAGQPGPGGCKGEECKTYCSDQAHSDECISFAEEHGFMTKDQADKARQMGQLATEGGPGGCKGNDACQAYCSDPAHQEECFNFAKAHNLVRPEDTQRFQESQKLNQAVSAGGGPGGCKTADECRTYCGDAAHVTECVAFGAARGAISPEEAKQRLKDFSEHLNGSDNNFGGIPPQGRPFPPPPQNGNGSGDNNPQGFPPQSNDWQNQGEGAQGGDRNGQQGQMDEFQKFVDQFQKEREGQSGTLKAGSQGPDGERPNTQNFRGQNPMMNHSRGTNSDNVGPNDQGSGAGGNNRNGGDDNRSDGQNFRPNQFIPPAGMKGWQRFNPSGQQKSDGSGGFNGEDGRQGGQYNEQPRQGFGQDGNFAPPSGGTMNQPRPMPNGPTDGGMMPQSGGTTGQMPPPPSSGSNGQMQTPPTPPSGTGSGGQTPPPPPPPPAPTSLNLIDGINSLAAGLAASFSGR